MLNRRGILGLLGLAPCAAVVMTRPPSMAYDRDKLVNKNKVEIDAVANFAMQLQISKRIELTQKRHDHHWQYIATKRKDTR